MRRYVLHVLLVALVVFVPIVAFSWWIEPLHGDLTRVGMWPERDYGPREPAVPIAVAATSGRQRNASILVLGDSFARDNLWQSVLQKSSGRSVQSFDIDRTCLTEWLAAALADRSSSVIVLESVERGVIAHFAQVRDCGQARIRPFEIEAGPTSNERPRWPLTLDARYLGRTALNLARASFSGEVRPGKSRTVNVPLRKDCARFSSRRSDRLLYYAEEDLKADWSEADIRASVARILEIQRAVEQAGKRFVFLLAPDKSAVYSTCFVEARPGSRAPRLNDLLIAAGVNAPDMTAEYEKRINTVVDLYNPDDTHWSNAGHVLAGEMVARFVGGGKAAH